jgi:hypothetical protein
MHYMDVGSTYEKVLCRNCPRLVGEDSHTQVQTGLPLKKCKCDRRYHEIKRLVVRGICSEIVVSNCLRCNTTDEFIDKRMTLCKMCRGAERRMDNGKKKVRHQFSARYGKWLRLAWQFGSGHNGTNEKQRNLAKEWEGMRGVTNIGPTMMIGGSGTTNHYG